VTEQKGPDEDVRGLVVFDGDHLLSQRKNNVKKLILSIGYNIPDTRYVSAQTRMTVWIFSKLMANITHKHYI
jgi:hypothetical protein